ncbi:hypothetical protein PT974_11497 [Cladobotryum mycophilum]|uniref:Uncharacterized protein n=1 Tax=Cladobotryum mycophilum TaxID=491253 RepID=A0ABR0S5E0_9HYPO
MDVKDVMDVMDATTMNPGNWSATLHKAPSAFAGNAPRSATSPDAGGERSNEWIYLSLFISKLYMTESRPNSLTLHPEILVASPDVVIVQSQIEWVADGFHPKFGKDQPPLSKSWQRSNQSASRR